MKLLKISNVPETLHILYMPRDTEELIKISGKGVDIEARPTIPENSFMSPAWGSSMSFINIKPPTKHQPFLRTISDRYRDLKITMLARMTPEQINKLIAQGRRGPFNRFLPNSFTVDPSNVFTWTIGSSST